MNIPLTPEQITIFAIIGGSLVLFIWNRWRYDLVALTALLASVLTGIVPPEKAFTGLADPVVTTVAAILVISAAISRSGFIDWCLSILSGVLERPNLQIIVLVSMVVVLSAFMNNVGALAVFLPITLAFAKKAGRAPSEMLMPLSFGSLLGGLITLIGTPPNILISSIRQDMLGAPYRMFDFAPVGIGVCVVGIVYLAFGWRLIPKARRGTTAAEDAFTLEDYISEVIVAADSPLIGQTVGQVEAQIEEEFSIVGIVHEQQRTLVPSEYALIGAGDTLMVETDPITLKGITDKLKLELAGSKEIEGIQLTSDDIHVVEAVIARDSPMIRTTPRRLRLRSRFGVNLLAVRHAAQSSGRTLGRWFFGDPAKPVRLGDRRLQEGDVIVLQGHKDTMADTLSALGCLPLAQRNLLLGRDRVAWLPVLVLAGSVALTVSNVLPIAIALLAGVLVIGFLRILRLNEMYAAIDPSVIVLLAAMIPVTSALQSTGGTEIIASVIAEITEGLTPTMMIGSIIVASMLVTPFLNNAATVLLMAPIAGGIATKLGYSPDPFLMAVAIGTSCDFLTPIGHQSNTLVMGPGGYKFNDYWRLGLPLSILVVLTATPLILLVWPVQG